MNERFDHKCQSRGFSFLTLLILVALLIFPALMAAHLAHIFDSRYIYGYLLAVSLVTFFLNMHDKRMAESGGWRTPEATLHLFEFLGGWPAAFIAQRVFRHKISKLRYQISFWMIVVLQEFVSFDFSQNWVLSKKAILLLQ